MTDWKRARRPEQKEERHAAILDAAARLVQAGALEDITIGAIAEGAGLAKASLYRYFATREEVLLAVLSRELSVWFTDVNQQLRRLAGRGSSEAVASILTGSLTERTLMTQLLAALAAEIEHNLSLETAQVFKVETHRQVAETGALIDAALPALPAGAGAKFVLWLQVLVSGIWPLAHPVGAVGEVLSQPAMAPMRIEFLPEFERMAVALLRGLEQHAET